jgi:hypothetical protein
MGILEYVHGNGRFVMLTCFSFFFDYRVSKLSEIPAFGLLPLNSPRYKVDLNLFACIG